VRANQDWVVEKDMTYKGRRSTLIYADKKKNQRCPREHLHRTAFGAVQVSTSFFTGQ
jgi:hypothetical protein